ncbi:MAG TPA: GNAT family N-acetyltransferase [Candidatus Nanopelagicales bacterium]|nr:GNAT family N-acetyltransferase [Candidatus Nanopelagicales bacterium]
MRTRLLDDPRDFLDATLELRAADPVRTNVIGSVAIGVVEGASYDAESWFVVEDDAGAVVGAAVWTAPYRLLASPMDDDAAHSLGLAARERSAQIGVAIPGVVGPAGVAEVTAAALGGVWRTSMAERLLVLHDYLRPSPVPGAGRPATEADLPLLVAWHTQFVADAGVTEHDTEASIRRRLPALRIWEVDGTPVAYAGHSPVVSTPSGAVGRIGPVFTTRDQRGRGYGTAITAVVVEALLPVTSAVMLYTDDANPTSNHVYENLGFVHEDDMVELTPVESAS